MCYGGWSGDKCVTEAAVIDLKLLDTSTDDSGIPAALAAATHVETVRFQVLGSKLLDPQTEGTGRTTRVEVLDASVVEEANYIEVDQVLLEDGTTNATVTSLVKELETLSSQSSTTLKTGPLASLQSIQAEPVTTCPEDEFYQCADGSCMPKTLGGTEIPEGGQCCTYNTTTDANTHCPQSTASVWQAHLTRCVAVNAGASYSCSSPLATSYQASYIHNSASAIVPNTALAIGLAIIQFAIGKMHA